MKQLLQANYLCTALGGFFNAAECLGEILFRGITTRHLDQCDGSVTERTGIRLRHHEARNSKNKEAMVSSTKRLLAGQSGGSAQLTLTLLMLPYGT